MSGRLLLPLLLSATLSACAGPGASGRNAGPVTVGIIAINDFHGSLEPPKLSVAAPDGNGGTVQVPAGGSAWLASAIDTVRAKYPNHVTVSAGDLISASQVASSIFLDEPAIGVMNRIGLDFNAVGNHEFDQGRAELLRKQTGGCEQHTLRKPCAVEPFTGAKFGFLSASTFTEEGRTLFPATGLRNLGSGAQKVTVGFIGLTLKETPNLVSPDGVKGLTFGDEADAVNAAVPRLKEQGADAIVVLIHQGGKPSGVPDPNGCEGLSGSILPILARMDPRVDVVVSGHTHAAYICDYGTIDPTRPFLLTSAGNYGQIVTDITLSIDTAGKRAVAKHATNIIVQSPGYASARGTVANTALYPRFEPRADIAAYVQRYTDAAREFAERPAGRIAGSAARPSPVMPGGGPLGNLIADAQLAATRGAGAQIAFTNPFGISAALEPAADGIVTFGQLYNIQPFDNVLITQSMSGAEIRAVLEQGIGGGGQEQILAASAGLVWRYDRSRPSGQRVVSVTLNGAELRSDATYRVTTNSFLAGGGDGFSGFARQRNAVRGMTDLDALAAWVAGPAPRKMPMEERATDAAR